MVDDTSSSHPPRQQPGSLPEEGSNGRQPGEVDRIIHNVRWFFLFRVFFHARFYYPVFTILFLDFGLTLEQFAILNAVWAASIVLLEVPSGALADVIGRTNLVRAAGLFMVIEILLLCWVPLGSGTLVFWVFVFNRVLSGAAEAAASGADEALAYDSLKAAGREDQWARVLSREMRIRSMAFMVALVVGAAVYDPALVTRVARWFGFEGTLEQSQTLRFPLYLNLVTAILAMAVAWKMREPSLSHQGHERLWDNLMSATRKTFAAGRWILRTPMALALIVIGMTFDHVARVAVTLKSEYYRLIELPEASFGLLGTAMAFLGVLVPRWAERFAEERSPAFNLMLLTGLTILGLAGMSLFLPYWGLIPSALLTVMFYFLGYFLSHYLNRITSSEQRATVLSFKGLAFNLAYGVAGILYSVLVARVRGVLTAGGGIPGPELEEELFRRAFSWFPGYFLVAIAVAVLFARFICRRPFREARDSVLG